MIAGTIKIHRRISCYLAQSDCCLPLPFVFTDSVAATTRTILIVAKAVMFVHACLIVLRVAARAVGPVSGRRPVDGLGVGPVTSCTGEVAAVILRFICQCRVTVIRGRPCVGDVAGITFLRRAEVTRVRTGCYDTVVTARTRAKHLCVVNSQYGRKYISGVAVFADIRRLRVSRIFAHRIRTVMAAEAVARDIDVIEIRR